MTPPPAALATVETPLPLGNLPADRLRSVDVVLTDIDDTLTLDGRLPAVAYGALERLRAAGKIVIPVTGRPAGWCDLIARLWPVDAVVGENGAFYFHHSPEKGMVRCYDRAAGQRARDRDRLEGVRDAVLRGVAGARVSADQAYRESDLAIDFAEDGPRLSDAAIDDIVATFAKAGATAKVSSIHVNGWFGDYDKLGMSARCLSEVFGIDIHSENARVAYVGDSPNDEPMFAFFDNSVAVANFAAFADRVERQPRYITAREGGEGFAEFAEQLLMSGR
ncbi:HAD-IIB family hydrolase [Pararhizobium haloflavum]|uniref:HAD-IIB family hydrolase n=1 Tax=Pararhizobium haloflavum TaxID=2037914 RepID=UPI000C198E36|nr:HAD-IIB family hydrolase [Pararhizobium haloflavum]